MANTAAISQALIDKASKNPSLARRKYPCTIGRGYIPDRLTDAFFAIGEQLTTKGRLIDDATLDRLKPTLLDAEREEIKKEHFVRRVIGAVETNAPPLIIDGKEYKPKRKKPNFDLETREAHNVIRTFFQDLFATNKNSP